MPETSDYTDFNKIAEIFQEVIHPCNRYLILWSESSVYL